MIQIAFTKEHTGGTGQQILLLTHEMGTKTKSYEAPLTVRTHPGRGPSTQA